MHLFLFRQKEVDTTTKFRGLPLLRHLIRHSLDTRFCNEQLHDYYFILSLALISDIYNYSKI